MTKRLICNVDIAMEVDEKLSILKSDLETHNIKLNNFFNEVFVVFLEEKEQIGHWLEADIFNKPLFVVIKEHIVEDYFSIELLNDNCLVVTNYNEQHEQTSIYYIYNLDMFGDCLFDIMFGYTDDLYMFNGYVGLNNKQIWEKMKNDSDCWGTILINNSNNK